MNAFLVATINVKVFPPRGVVHSSTGALDAELVLSCSIFYFEVMFLQANTASASRFRAQGMLNIFSEILQGNTRKTLYMKRTRS